MPRAIDIVMTNEQHIERSIKMNITKETYVSAWFDPEKIAGFVIWGVGATAESASAAAEKHGCKYAPMTIKQFSTKSGVGVEWVIEIAKSRAVLDAED